MSASTASEDGRINRRAVARNLLFNDTELGVTVIELDDALSRAGWTMSRKTIRNHLNRLFTDGHATHGTDPAGGGTYRWRITDAGRQHYGEPDAQA